MKESTLCHIFYLIIIYRQIIFRNNLILRGPGKFSQIRIFDRKFIRHIVQDKLFTQFRPDFLKICYGAKARNFFPTLGGQIIYFNYKNCQTNVGQKEDFMHSNFQMDISLLWIDATFT